MDYLTERKLDYLIKLLDKTICPASKDKICAVIVLTVQGK